MKTILHFAIILSIVLLATEINAQNKVSFSEITTNTKSITTTYFNDYINLDFDALKSQMDNDISFNDTTAKLIFGIELVEGKKQVFENFKNTYTSIVEMKADIIRTIFSSHVGIFEIELTYKFKVGIEKVITIKKMPLIVVLTVKDGKISEHKDYGDYNHFLEQYSNQTKK
ncbi:MAG: hypothetical protein COB12_10210 [Flavobacterium sp.]|nr:MAG: hypothetical protein COB12_10210 [Flavobacterium sp.]